MRVTSISYRETQTFGNYQNVTVDMTAALNDEDYADACDTLKGIVQSRIAARIAEHERRDYEAYERQEKSGELRDLESKVEEAREQWEKAKAFLAAHGIEAVEGFPF